MNKQDGKNKIIDINILGHTFKIKGEDEKYLLKLQKDIYGRLEDKKELLIKYAEIEVLTMIALEILDEKKKIEREYTQLKEIAKKMELGSNKI